MKKESTMFNYNEIYKMEDHRRKLRQEAETSRQLSIARQSSTGRKRPNHFKVILLSILKLITSIA
jgi:hypothetical protein